MNEFTASISTGSDGLNVVLLIGIAIFVGTVGAKIFQRLRLPQVVGYVVVGLFIGESGFGLLKTETVEGLSFFSIFALGIIGFMIGGELRWEVFKKQGKQFFVILISEGVAAFILVGLLSGFVGWIFTRDVGTSVAMGLVLGSIASATAPAATANVLWEYKTRGPLTSTVLAIVALDDGLSLLLYGIASSMAAALLGETNGTTLWALAGAAVEVIGSVILGIFAGVVLSFLLNRIKESDKSLAFVVSSVLLVIGISIVLNLGAILASMSLGVTIANFSGRKRRRTFELLEKFSSPIYVLFFVLAGAHLVIGEIESWMVMMVFVYLFGRTAGKMLGSWFGSVRSHALEAVRKYLGFCLLSQAGVAIGLAIISSRLFAGQVGHAIVVIVMTTTFIVEIIGPMFVKYGVKKAGEVGLNITEEDLIKTYKVGDVMEKEPTSIAEDLPLHQILEIFSTSDSVYYPVIDSGSRVRGKITIAGIKEMFANQDVAGWLLACDVAEPVLDKTTSEKSLEEVMELMRRYELEHISVVADEASNKLVGVLDYRRVLRNISAEVLSRRKQADEMALGTA